MGPANEVLEGLEELETSGISRVQLMEVLPKSLAVLGGSRADVVTT